MSAPDLSGMSGRLRRWSKCMMGAVTGPSAAVLLPDPWTASDVAPFRAWLAESLTVAADDWWTLREPRRLDWRTASPDTGPMLIEPGGWDGTPDEAASLARVAGFRPAAEVVLASATNGGDDHRFLAWLAVAVARRYGGLIDLTGPLPVPPPPGESALEALASGAARERWWASSRATIATLSGTWHEIPYLTASNTTAVYHVVNADLLTSWLEHPLFRMVK
jgi:hypothetical protein